MTKNRSQNFGSKNKRIGKMYGTRSINKTNKIYSKQSDQNDDSGRPSRPDDYRARIRQNR